MLTLKDLAREILALPAADLGRPAGVWPPGACPAASSVRVAGLGRGPGGVPVLLTGKEPGAGADAAPGVQ